MRPYFRTATILANDIGFVFLSFLIAGLLVHFSFPWSQPQAWIAFSLLALAQVAVSIHCGLYRTSLRYASVGFAITVLKAVFIGELVFILGLYIAQVHVAVEVLFIDWMLKSMSIGGSRFFVRYFYDVRKQFQIRRGRRIIIYGAGDMGVMALRQLQIDRSVSYSPIAYLDDNPSKWGKMFQGLKVLGGIDDLERVLESYQIEEIVVAISVIKGEKLREIVKRCRKMNIVCRIVPSFSQIFDIDPKMRKVELADLMRRIPRDLNKDEIRAYLSEKSVLITGAAGTIGSELVRQSLQHGPRKIIALDNSEFGLYSLREELGDQNIEYLLEDASDFSTMNAVFQKTRPDIVFHAAAYKHVHMLEDNRTAAIRNNIGSTKVCAELASAHGVKSFVLISTDKAVRPAGIMGATKRISELFVQNFNRRSKTEFVAVRFGNVLGSSGSVIPKFLEQIRNGGPVTVTHPDATRYFMLIDEAVQLVLQAAAIGHGGELFILNMGEPVKIVEVAEDLIYLMGKQPHKDIEIIYTGLRPGEKIREELFHEEIEEQTSFEDITVGKSTLLDWEWLEQGVDQLLALSFHDAGASIDGLIRDLVHIDPLRKVPLASIQGKKEMLSSISTPA